MTGKCFVELTHFPPASLFSPIANEQGQQLVTPGTDKGTTLYAYRNALGTAPFLATSQPLCQPKPKKCRRGVTLYERHASTSGPENVNRDQEEKVQMTATADHKTVMLISADTQANILRANEFNPEKNFSSGHMKDFMIVGSHNSAVAVGADPDQPGFVVPSKPVNPRT